MMTLLMMKTTTACDSPFIDMVHMHLPACSSEVVADADDTVDAHEDGNVM